MLTLQTIREAQRRLAGRVHRTPVFTSRAFDEAAGCRTFFKCENLQRAGAFKARGALNKILSLTDEQRQKGVVAFSSGNHAQAVALAARATGARATIVMPQDAPRAKLAATRGYGAEVVLVDRANNNREQVAREICERTGGVLVPPYDDYLVMAGQGTAGLELMEDAPALDALFVPCSGGGLFAGVSVAAKAQRPEIRCFPVEPNTANDTQQSFAAGTRLTTPLSPSIADGLLVQTPGALTFPILQQNAEQVLTVTDDEIRATMRFLLFRLKLLVEPSGAAAAAAVLHGKRPAGIETAGVILSGGNVDAERLAEALAD
jgi:threonine dehydratase